MSDDLVKRLRASGKHPLMNNTCHADVFDVHEAADRIESLTAERDALKAAQIDAIRAALEAAAKCCDDEADKCDDAIKWGGSTRYKQDCKAAAYAMRDRSEKIRAIDPASLSRIAPTGGEGR